MCLCFILCCSFIRITYLKNPIFLLYNNIIFITLLTCLIYYHKLSNLSSIFYHIVKLCFTYILNRRYILIIHYFFEYLTYLVMIIPLRQFFLTSSVNSLTAFALFCVVKGNIKPRVISIISCE